MGGKNRTCKVCDVFVTSIDKYVRYEGMCGKCYQLSKVPKFLAYNCYICKEKKTMMKMGVFDTLTCDDCCQNFKHYCATDNIHDKCLLTNKCCLCQDKRPLKKEGTYDGYIDGIGHVTMKNRWDFYCDTCCHTYMSRPFNSQLCIIIYYNLIFIEERLIRKNN